MEPVLKEQAGVVARRQLIACGLNDADIRRKIRRRELSVIHPGVYVDHTGVPTWLQRAWAAIHYAWPAALGGESALRAAEGPGRVKQEDTIHVVISRHRRVEPQDGIELHRQTDLEARVLWNVGPPRLRYEEATVDVALTAATQLEAIGVLAGACGTRRTTAARLTETMSQRTRVAGRAWLLKVLDDIAEGTCSVLEHGYLQRVERAHGLPRARRQVRAFGASGVTYRDAEHPGLLVVELDGRLFHDSASARDRDLERDLDSVLDGRATVRLGWGQVFDRPCSTAVKISRLLIDRGWGGDPHPCGAACGLSGNISVAR